MESALLAAKVILAPLQAGKLDSQAFSAYEHAYKSYFDPAMIFVDLCAATLRNPHYWGSWKKALIRGCSIAQKDKAFAETAGACFGGLSVNPTGILAEVWKKTAENLIAAGPASVMDLANGRFGSAAAAFAEGAGWMIDSLNRLPTIPTGTRAGPWMCRGNGFMPSHE